MASYKWFQSESFSEHMEIDQSLALKRDNIFDRLVLNIATFFFIMTVVMATVQVVVRVFELPIPGGAWWTVAVARYCLIIGTFFGAAVASRNREHIKMDILNGYLEQNFPRLGIAVDVFVQLVVIAFLGVTVYAASLAMVQNRGELLLDLPIPSSYLYGAIAAGLAVTMIYELLHLTQIVNLDKYTTDFINEVKS